MTDLGDQLGAYIDTAAPAITISEVQGGDRHDGRPEDRRWRAVLALAVAAALLIGIGFVLRGPQGDEQVVAGPKATGATTGTAPLAADRFCVASVAFVRDFSQAPPAPGSPGPTIDSTQRIQDARNRLHEIAELAPPNDAPYWSALASRADIAPTAADDPPLFNSIDEAVAWRCGSVIASAPASDLVAFCAAARSYYVAAATPLDGKAGTARSTPTSDVAARAREAADVAPPGVSAEWRRLASLEQDEASQTERDRVRQRLNTLFVAQCP